MNMIAGYFMGLAVAACFAGTADSFLYLIGGIAGALPAVLDGTFARRMVRPDIDIIPDPLDPDASAVAGAIADSVNKSFIEDKPVTVRLRSARLDENTMQRYEIAFDVARREVKVSFGEQLVSTACHNYYLRLGSAGRINVSDEDGAMLAFNKDAGLVRVSRDPHRFTWSHSLVTGLLLSLASAALLGLSGGAVFLSAWCLHLAFTFLGSHDIAPWFPFSQLRIRGRRRISQDSDIMSHI